ncbi:hypothetical protein B0H12DRAFT_546451 [Mycena haematopus]|nr:hypothetical protein B0H12DRAFT_546451 [Mycena haematopus]
MRGTAPKYRLNALWEIRSRSWSGATRRHLSDFRDPYSPQVLLTLGFSTTDSLHTHLLLNCIHIHRFSENIHENPASFEHSCAKLSISLNLLVDLHIGPFFPSRHLLCAGRLWGRPRHHLGLPGERLLLLQFAARDTGIVREREQQRQNHAPERWERR